MKLHTRQHDYGHFPQVLPRNRMPTHFVILSSILRGSRIKVGSTTRLRSAPGRSCEIICERTIPITHQSSHSLLLVTCGKCIPFPWSGSTTVVSSSGSEIFDSSTDDRLPRIPILSLVMFSSSYMGCCS